jgi:hypothetical protein
MRFSQKETHEGCLVGTTGWMTLKVLDGPGAALDSSRNSCYTEVVRHHFWLPYVKWEQLEEIPDSNANWGLW